MTRGRDLVTRSGAPLAPLGLAGHPETPPECVGEALERGVNAVFFYDHGAAGMLDGLAAALPGRRDDVFVMTGTEARDVAGARADLDAARERLGIDAVDAFLVLYVAPGDAEGDVDALLDALAAWRGDGSLRHAGVSAHSRPLAARYVADPRVDVLMHRYNMAHRGAEEAVLPAARAAGTPVVAFTCTRWGTLLRPRADWPGPVPSAADCYRFALARPEVRLALSAPRSVAELRQNLAVLDAPPPTREELAGWRRVGALVHGDGTSEFETRWP